MTPLKSYGTAQNACSHFLQAKKETEEDSTEPPSEIVFPDWIGTQMLKHEIGVEGLVEDFGIGKSDISAHGEWATAKMNIGPTTIALEFNDCINNRNIDRLAAFMTDYHRFSDPADHQVSGKQNCVRAWSSFFRGKSNLNSEN